MEDIELKKNLEELVHQCDAYLVVLPKNNSEALAIVDQFKTQITTLLTFFKADEKEVSKSILSPREHQVLALVAQGHPNKEIAYQLSISPKTVQFHLKSVFTKLEVGSRTEAVTVAIKMGLISIA